MSCRRTCAALLCAVLAVRASAATPVSTAFSYQGQLKSGGTPLTGTADLHFRLYDAAGGGAQVGGQVNVDGVTVSGGLFAATLDFGVAPWTANEARWLEIDVRSPAGNGTFVTLAPRQPLTPTPFALSVRGLAVDAGGNVGVGTTAPLARLDIQGGADSDGSDDPHALAFEWRSGGFRHWIRTRHNAGAGAANAFDFFTNTSADPNGSSAPGTGNVQSLTLADGRAGIGTTSPGYPLHVEGGAANIAAYAHNAGTNAAMQYWGLWAQTDGPHSSAVYGAAGASTGQAIGIQGNTSSVDGAGVAGTALASSGVNFGVYGATNSSAGYGVYCVGRFAASGTKSFQIDHPLDPANRLLSHYCAEGPEPLNIYSGNVVTDESGLALVQLPDYFEAINRDFRYQLTVVDDGDSQDFVQVKVVRKIRDGQFAVRTSAPGVEVSWRVEAVRNDPWLAAYGAPVEVEKTGAQRGRYLSPELYGQPPDLRMLATRTNADAPTPQSQ